MERHRRSHGHKVSRDLVIGDPVELRKDDEN